MAGVVANNATSGVTWIATYVTTDKLRTVCIYDEPDPESIRKVAGLSGIPVDDVTPVRVLDPYFYVGGVSWA
ncbi:MAG TPA: nickel-binding protein [Acidimicrobiia bacterium]|nr:nickel-binding protein [Acidimicrobiia bacterium]